MMFLTKNKQRKTLKDSTIPTC